MTKRRAHGDGAIYYEASRERWVGSIDLGIDGTGKRRRAKVTGDSRADVARRLRERRQAIEAGDTAGTMTVAALLDQFSAAVVPTMTENTGARVLSHVLAARSGVGALRLVDLRAHHVEAWLKTRAEAGLSRSVVTRDRGTLARVLRWGQRRDIVARNAAELAEMPATRPPKEGRALTADELRRLLHVAAGSRLEALWWVMGGLGLRPGEVAGLMWPDVDLDGAVLHVRRTRKVRAGRLVMGDLKTARSRRSLAMPAPVVEALRSHRRHWTEERLLLGQGWPAEWAEVVFVTEAGTPADPSNLRRELDRLTEAAGLGALRPYDLRHTAASLMADLGTPLERVADVLGHAGITMARTTYVHAVAPTVDGAVAPMDLALA